MKKLIFVLCFALTGCVTTANFTGPNGEHGHLTKCNGAARSMADCYNKATEVCEGRGYEVVDGMEKSCGAFVSGGMIMAAACRELTYTCK